MAYFYTRATRYFGPVNQNTGNPKAESFRAPCPENKMLWATKSGTTCKAICSSPQLFDNCPSMGSARPNRLDIVKKNLSYGCKTPAVGYTEQEAAEDGWHDIKCRYDPNNFKNTYEVEKWMETTGDDGKDDLDEKIFPVYCSQLGDICPPDSPLDENGLSYCSRFMSQGNDGFYCNDWASRKPALADVAKRNYCKSRKGKKDPACRCLNRNDPEVNKNHDKYVILKAIAGSANDACWYAPCSNSTSNILTSDITNPSQPCPDVCRQINAFTAGEEIDIGDLNQEIICGSFDDADTTTIIPPDDFDSDSDSKVSYKYVIGGGAVIVTSILLISLGYYFLNKKKNK